MNGIFYAVGVGPGGSGMLTLDAVRTVERCGTVCFPETEGGRHIAYDAVRAACALGGKELLFLPVPMKRDPSAARAAYADMAAACGKRLGEGGSVAFVSVGDVALYSTASHVARLVASLGFETRFVAGVTSFSAAACACATSLSGRDEVVSVIPAAACIRSGRLHEVLSSPGTKVFMKAGRSLPALVKAVSDAGLSPRSFLVQNVTLPDERRYTGGELSALPAGAFEDAYLSVLIVLSEEAAL